MDETNDACNFGKSQFKGQSGLSFELYRWCVQFTALVIKNFAVMIRRPAQLIVFLLLPSAVFLTFLLQNHEVNDNENSENVYPSIPVEDIGHCDVYYDSKCTRVAYGPMDDTTVEVMNNFCELNGLVYGKDVKGFDTVSR